MLASVFQCYQSKTFAAVSKILLLHSVDLQPGTYSVVSKQSDHSEGLLVYRLIILKSKYTGSVIYFRFKDIQGHSSFVRTLL